MEQKQIDKIEEHLKDILNECEQKNYVDMKQIKHNVFEIREHLKVKTEIQRLIFINKSMKFKK